MYVYICIYIYIYIYISSQRARLSSRSRFVSSATYLRKKIRRVGFTTRKEKDEKGGKRAGSWPQGAVPHRRDAVTGRQLGRPARLESTHTTK